MRSFVVIFSILCFCGSYHALDIKEFLGDEPLTTKIVVQEIIDYFKADDPHGIPVLEIPEPLKIEGPYEGTLNLTNISISGHSQLKLEYVDVNLELLQLQLKITIPKLEILAQYVWPGFWSNSEGDMNVTFVALQVGAKIDLGTNKDGLIQVINLEPIFEKELFIPDFTGLITQHAITVSVADTLFNTLILPAVQGKIRDTGISRINEQLEQKLTKKFPVDISPVDFAIAYAKKQAAILLPNGIESLPIKDQEVNLPLPVTLVIKNTYLEGLSSLHRTKLIRTEFVDNKVYVTIQLGTQNLKASTDWSLYSSVFSLCSGHSDLLIDSFDISIEVLQAADIRHPPIMRFVDLKFGNIALRSSGERNLDYALEAIVNLLPNILRNIVLDKKIEKTIKKIAQEKFNTLNWEQIIAQRLNKY